MNRVLELLAVPDSLFENLHGLCVGHSLELDAQDALKPFDKSVIVLVVEELEVVRTVVKSVLHKVFHELLGQHHVVVDVVERHLRLDHPELREMPWSVGVLSPESRTESVDLADGRRSKLTLKLSAHGKARLLSEEVLAEINFPVLFLGNVLKIESRDLEHVSRSLCVRFCDKRCVEVNESLVVEELVNGERHGVTDSQHCSERVCPRTEVRDCAEIFKRSVLLLERVPDRVAFSEHLDLLCLDLDCLSASY